MQVFINFCLNFFFKNLSLLLNSINIKDIFAIKLYDYFIGAILNFSIENDFYIEPLLTFKSNFIPLTRCSFTGIREIAENFKIMFLNSGFNIRLLNGYLIQKNNKDIFSIYIKIKKYLYDFFEIENVPQSYANTDFITKIIIFSKSIKTWTFILLICSLGASGAYFIYYVIVDMKFFEQRFFSLTYLLSLVPEMFVAIILEIVCVLIAVAYLTLLERKIMAGIQRRRGPMMIGFIGLLQPFADGLKLFTKELIMPIKANNLLFVLAPIMFLTLALLNWSLIPIGYGKIIADMPLGILFILGVSSFSVYGLILGGWSSNSQYAFLGCLRSAAQMISYEISLSLLIFCIAVLAEGLNLTTIVFMQEKMYFFLPLLLIAVIFFISCLAETSRPPFDLPEAEAELVAGYNVEYSSMGFAFFFIAEYMNIIFMSFLTSIIFYGGWLVLINFRFLIFLPAIFWLFFKSLFFIILFIWVRAALPRYRFDQLMALSWKNFLPLAFVFLFLVFSIKENFYYNGLFFLSSKYLYWQVMKVDSGSIIGIPITRSGYLVEEEKPGFFSLIEELPLNSKFYFARIVCKFGRRRKRKVLVQQLMDNCGTPFAARYVQIFEGELYVNTTLDHVNVSVDVGDIIIFDNAELKALNALRRQTKNLEEKIVNLSQKIITLPQKINITQLKIYSDKLKFLCNRIKQSDKQSLNNLERKIINLFEKIDNLSKKIITLPQKGDITQLKIYSDKLKFLCSHIKQSDKQPLEKLKVDYNDELKILRKRIEELEKELLKK